MLTKYEISQVLSILKQKYNHRTTALIFVTPFQLLISTMLAAQSTDVQVNLVTKKLFNQYRNAYAFLNLNLETLENKIKTVGLYKSKAKNILATCHMLVQNYGGEIPTTREELMQLPGVGRKTANVVLSIAFGMQAIAVDTHVFRVSNRVGLANAADVTNAENQLMKNIPQKNWSAAHHWLIWHGRQICKARNPLCNTCFLATYCLYYKNNNKEV